MTQAVITYFDSLNRCELGYPTLGTSDTSYAVNDGTGDFISAGYTQWVIYNGLDQNQAGTHTSLTGAALTKIYTTGDTLSSDSGTSGVPATYYLYRINVACYPTEADALALTNCLGGTDNVYYSIPELGGNSAWKIASNSTGTSSQLIAYAAGQGLNTNGTYVMYPVKMIYYGNQANALSHTNPIGDSGLDTSYTLTTIGINSTWRIASNSTGISSPLHTFASGSVLNASGTYFLYVPTPCFLEGTKILCQVNGVDTYLPIESMTSETIVKSTDGYKKVALLGKQVIENQGTDERTENRLYKCSNTNYPELTEDLYLTGCHSILVSNLTDVQREKTIKHLGKIYVTAKKYRLITCIDERAEPWKSEGSYTVWHVALDDPNEKVNFGIYANGL
jgi:hypothetical protein